MKIQFFGNNTFGIIGKDAHMVFDPADNFAGKNLDFSTNSNGIAAKGTSAKKLLTFPGEYEISNVLVHSMAQKNSKNIIFKVIIDGFSVVHCGEMSEVPNKDMFEELGEDIDILIVNVSEKFNAKKIKEVLETIDPRIAFIGGDSTHFPEVKEIVPIQTSEDNPLAISKSGLSEDKSAYYILNV